MKENKKLHSAISIGIYAAVLGTCIATLFFPQTGRLAIVKEIGMAVLLLIHAMLVGYIAFRHKELWHVALFGVIVATCIACFGAVRTVSIINDIQSGPQTIELSNCQLVPGYNANMSIVSTGYGIKGTDENGKSYEFPLMENEYRSLARKMENSTDTWHVKAIAYLHCQRIVTFTAEKTTTKSGGVENGD